MRDTRVFAWTGVAATVAIAAGAVILGSAPKSNDAADVALRLTRDHRGRLLASMWVLGFGMVLSLVFVVGLSAVLRRPGSASDPWPTVVLTTGIATFTLGLAALSFVSSAAYRSNDLSADSARSLWDLFAATTNVSNVATVFLTAAVGIMILGGDVLPRWIGWSSFVVALAHLVATLSLARDGAFSPTGALGQAPGFLYLVWMLAASVALLRAGKRVREFVSSH